MNLPARLDGHSKPQLPATHYLDNHIYTDTAVFEREQQHILASCWRFVCHASEIPQPFGMADLGVFHIHRTEIQANWKLFVETNYEGYHELLHLLNRTISALRELVGQGTDFKSVPGYCINKMRDIIAHCELNRLIHASARYLDDHDFQAYLELYREEGVYTVIAKALELAEPMVWMRHSCSELRERIAAMTEQEWEIADVEQTRVLSVDLVEVSGDTANTSSSFALYHTDQEGITSCYAVGRYDDCWEKDTNSWMLRSRRVGLKTRQLSMPSPLPI